MQTKKNPISSSSPEGSRADFCSQRELSFTRRSVPALLPEKQDGGRFRSEEHLKKKVEITGVFKKGRTVGYSGIKLFFLANEFPYNRIVITFTRKYGNAVQRNRARRLVREAYRLMKGGLKTGYDLVFLIYPRTESSPSKREDGLSKTAVQLQILFKKAGMIRQEA